jgi:hypothetical protein
MSTIWYCRMVSVHIQYAWPGPHSGSWPQGTAPYVPSLQLGLPIYSIDILYARGLGRGGGVIASIMKQYSNYFMYWRLILCTFHIAADFLIVPYGRGGGEWVLYVSERSFMYDTVSCWFSNKFCDLSLLHWLLFRAVKRCGGGGSAVRKMYCTRPWKLAMILLITC